ncbi:MAG: hypothetical protein R3B70_06515 [Polyangiaceae bacterium]
MTELGRLVDKAALDADDGPRARAKVTVPASWGSEGALIEVTLPRTLECARCDGGGCDACGRSGALRGPGAERARVVRVRLPKAMGDGVAMRLGKPFGKASKIAQLWLEVRPGKAASASVRKLSRVPRVRRRILPRLVLALTVAVVIIGAALAVITWLRG